jgi:glycosyltransferase involved in cell wall biosynthesis
MALVHRLMTLVLVQCATRIWVAIPAWESKLRPYALGRQVRMDWLPIPGCAVSRETVAVSSVRQRYASESQPLLGHFGSYGREVSALLEERLASIMGGEARPAVLLIGAGSDAFREGLVTRRPEWASRVHATGYVTPSALAAHLQACDVLVQPYPDGITSRRTSAMACLALGRPVVTTTGHLTESFWAESGAVAMANVGDRASFESAVARLIGDPDSRDALSQCARRLYSQRFDVAHTIQALRTA